jgi:hypothetical protein
MTDYDEGSAVAGRIEREHRRWVVVFGVFSRQFVAFPLFDTPGPLRIECHDPGQLTRQMHEAERNYGRHFSLRN